MQKKWVIGAAVSTLSIGVIGVSAAFAASASHLSDQSGVTIAAGVEGQGTTQAETSNVQRLGESPGTQSQTDTKNEAKNNSGQNQSNQHSTKDQAPAQTQQPVQTQQPQAPVPAPPPAPQSVSSVSVESFD